MYASHTRLAQPLFVGKASNSESLEWTFGALDGIDCENYTVSTFESE